jgi:hypothetical protein
MKTIIWISFVSALLATPVYAGQTTLIETDTGITVVYTPDEADSASAEIAREQDESRIAAEAADNKKLTEKRSRQGARNSHDRDGDDGKKSEAGGE